MNELYRLENVSKIYRLNKINVNALKNISITINKNECIALTGPSGSGKSTLLHLLGTVDKPDSGKIFFNDKELCLLNDSELSDIRSGNIGFIFQNFNLIPVLSVYENIEYPLRIKDIRITREIKERILKLIDDTGLTGHIRHKPSQLSGGQRQRTAIARALVIEPDVILADEPTANLDSMTGDRILELIRELSVRHNTTVVFSTHDKKILDYTNRQIALKDGSISDCVLCG